MDDPGKIQKQQPSLLRTIFFGRNPERTYARLAVLIVLGIALILVSAFVLRPVRVEGPSMLPTYADKGLNLLNRLAYLFHEPRHGDVVIIHMPKVNLFKRIVGLPGETVSFHHGKLFVNGKPVDEPYEKLRCRWEDDGEHTPRTLGAHEYFYVGDNRSMPMPFHAFGVANRRDIMGKILLCKNLFGS